MADFLSNSTKLFKKYKTLGEKAIAQSSDKMLFQEPVTGVNSISIIIRHLHGNMKSRWTDFLTTDGEKPWRNRDEEFEEFITTRAMLLLIWEEGWKYLFTALDSLTPEDLDRVVVIRNEEQTVLEAIQRQIAHYAYHVGQIVYIAKMEQGSNWTSLSIPCNTSDAYNAAKFIQENKGNHFTDEFLK